MNTLCTVLSVVSLVILISLPAKANNVTSSGGTTYRIPMFFGGTYNIETSGAWISGTYLQYDGGLKSSYTFPNLYLYETDTSKSWYIGVSASEFQIWDTGTVRLTIEPGGEVGIGTVNPAYELDVSGEGRFTSNLFVGSSLDVEDDVWVDGDLRMVFGDVIVGFGYVDAVSNNMYAGDFLPTCPYPENLEVAYDSVLSMQRLPDGEYDPNDIHNQLDHSSLNDFLSRESPSGRPAYSLASITGAQNEVIKDLVQRIGELEAQVGRLEALLGEQR